MEAAEHTHTHRQMELSYCKHSKRFEYLFNFHILSTLKKKLTRKELLINSLHYKKKYQSILYNLLRFNTKRSFKIVS